LPRQDRGTLAGQRGGVFKTAQCQRAAEITPAVIGCGA
jgi:hypothetical protein